MTEKKSLAHHEKHQHKPEEKKKRQEAKGVKSPSRRIVIASAILLNLFSLFLIIGFYIYTQSQNKLQEAKINSLREQVANLQLNLSDKASQNSAFVSTTTNRISSFQDQLEYDQKMLKQLQEASDQNSKSIAKLNERLSALSPTDSNNWLIAEANYLVALASRKIWQDQDYVTARLLLKNANQNLEATHDPSLLPAREAITEDLAALSQIPRIDVDGIMFQLLSLANQVSSLPLANNDDLIKAPLEHQNDTLSEKDKSFIQMTHASDSFLSQIKIMFERFKHRLFVFLHQFIKIEKYDELTECIIKAGNNKNSIQQCKLFRGLITPEQGLYLRENIRLQLYIASQAAIRHQNDIYQHALNDVSMWVYAYFDLNDQITIAFMEDIEELQKQVITTQNVLKTLKSASILDNIMQTRIRSLLTAN